MEKIETEILIVGGGVLGLAIGAALAKLGQQVVLIEKEELLSQHSSSRNSEVIHAGVYYPTNSLKQVHCVEGKHLLYKYLEQMGIPYQMCGKVIFGSTKEDELVVNKLHNLAKNNGVEVSLINKKYINELSEYCHINFGIFSPSTGIFDSHQYLEALAFEIEEYDGIISKNTAWISAQIEANHTNSICNCRGELVEIKSKKFINAAGLSALKIAQSMDLKTFSNYRDVFVKGHYYSYTKTGKVKRLLYPCPSEHGLGVHLTIDLQGRMRFGPDTEMLSQEQNYQQTCSDNIFHAKVQRNFKIPDTSNLKYDYSGIRTKIAIDGKISDDFQIIVDDYRIVHLLGIDSPGLTSSLSIAKYVMEQLN